MKKLLVVLLGLASLNVCVANPTYDATRGALQNDPGLCQYGYNRNCGSSGYSQQRQPTKIINIDVPSKYGAWAVNPKTGLSADVINAPSLETTKNGAIKACEQGGQNAPCKVVASVRNGCIAVAQGQEGKKSRVFPGVTAQPGLSEAEALRKCRAAGVPQCKITTPEGCSLPKF
ncbi:DUF4189 domain-containing protein [Neisseria subflava]|uniref:DUF4189 domain-containing protein n=1 Tax=Neisseria subflava TaxID=28449 RepID=A0A9X9HXI7_NEISU|nr:DUF4189 domain-containing protein [Neisseria subflava]UTG71371.1 DUF4189 domain-containing protein [Neisseria subflava]